ncbi:MAG: glycerophosphodiester phosphodiesterase [Clostridiales bacterium]|nr:glycerophosphodiester phosphodiesterase [Clostridiales bacterium]
MMEFLLGLFIGLMAVAAAYLFLIAPNPRRRLCPARKRSWMYFAHRGLHDNNRSIPENSLAAFRLAVDKGYGIELDVHLTKDHALVVHHDDSLLRLCGEDVRLSGATLEELAGYRLGDTDEIIPTLDQVLEIVKGQVPLLIELKSDRIGDTALAARVHEKMRGYQGIWWVQSFDPLLMRWFKKHAPMVIRGQLAVDQTKQKGKKPSLIEKMAGHLLFHFLSRPDFVAYGYETDSNFSFRVMRALFHPTLAAWTVRSKKEFDRLQDQYTVQIFEAFRP